MCHLCAGASWATDTWDGFSLAGSTSVANTTTASSNIFSRLNDTGLKENFQHITVNQNVATAFVVTTVKQMHPYFPDEPKWTDTCRPRDSANASKP